MLARRPMTAADLAKVFGLPLAQVRQRLLHLCETGQVAGQPYCDQEFYRQASEAWNQSHGILAATRPP